MVTPTRAAVLAKAEEMALEAQIKVGLPAIVPTVDELKESSFYTKARDELMREARDPLHQQLDYLQQMASEIDYAVIEKKELRKLERCCARAEVPIKVKKPKPIIKPVPIVKRIKKVVVAKPKRRVPIPVGVIEYSDEEWGIKPRR